MIEVNESILIGLLSWTDADSLHYYDREGIGEQFYAQMMGWA